MDESIVRGLVMGATLGAVGLGATLLWTLIQSKSEGARRLRVVLMLAAAATYVAAIISVPQDAPILIGVGLVLAAGVWVFKGTKK